MSRAAESLELRSSWRFFLEHAGYVDGRRAAGALEYARAEQELERRGWRLELEPDADAGDDAGEPARGYAPFVAILEDSDGRALGVLGSVWLRESAPDLDAYARTVRAELALEALERLGARATPLELARIEQELGAAVLEWAGLETPDGDSAAPLERLEAFREALGFSSVPEACSVVAESLAG